MKNPNTAQLCIFADAHNTPWFHQCLQRASQFSETQIISLGDIAAVDTKEFLQQQERYHLTWKYKKGKIKAGVTQKDVTWFDNLNKRGWKKQMIELDNFQSIIHMCQGNTDHAYLTWYNPSISKNLFIFSSITLTYYGKQAVLYLPYASGIISDQQVKEIPTDKILILSHCPPLPATKKDYYTELYENLKKISKHTKKIIFIHGHMHADNTYTYTLEDLPSVTICIPKATDSKEGMGSYHHLILFDTNNFTFTVKDLNRNTMQPNDLPREYYQLDEHWNQFKKNKI